MTSVREVEMNVTFIGATHEVTGSCTLIEVNGKNILVDCGMEQGADIFENIQIPVDPRDIDMVVVTHAHIDHSGKLPFLVAHGYTGPIYSTEATRQLCNIMLLDSAHIQEFEAKWRNRKGKRAGREDYVPLYTTEDAQNTLKKFKTAGYNEEIEISEGVTIEYIDAGHLLGSSNVLFTLKEGGKEKTILFSGDLGNINKPLIRSPQTPPNADYVVCESTYGDRLHDEKPDYVKDISEIIQRTLDRGGNVVIPAFAVGRTQELLYYIRVIKENDLVKNHDGFPVYVDSPLAVEATNIYSSGMDAYYDEEALDLVKKGINPIAFPDLKVSVSTDESIAINADTTPKVIISAAGMCEAGRIRHHLKHNLWRPECSVLFVGYQSPGTVGAKLLDGDESIKLFGEEIAVKAEIKRIEAFSSHADKNMLLEWLEEVNPNVQIFINHGEDRVTDEFAEEASKLLKKPAVAPYSGEVWNLETCELVRKAEVIPVIRKEAQGGVETHNAQAKGKPSGSKKEEGASRDTGEVEARGYKITKATGKAVSAYNKLSNAGVDLMNLIEKSKGSSNKDLKELTDEIIKLTEKHKLLEDEKK